MNLPDFDPLASTHGSYGHEFELSELAKYADEYSAERKVRAVVQVGHFGTPWAWQGSQPRLMVFWRKLDRPRIERTKHVQLEFWPVEELERWNSQNSQNSQNSESNQIDCSMHQLSPALLGQLATGRALYDPAKLYGRMQRRLQHWSPEQWQSYRKYLLQQARSRQSELLESCENVGGRFSSSSASSVFVAPSTFPILALVKSRQIAVNWLYPALLSFANVAGVTSVAGQVHMWPTFEWRLPHVWRMQLGLSFPKIIAGFERLYAFDHEAEAKRVLQASRGMGLLATEQQARLAIQAGYYDGAVRYLRDRSAQTHLSDIENWACLGDRRREKLSTLLGVTRAPLGAAALEVLDVLLGGLAELVSLH